MNYSGFGMKKILLFVLVLAAVGLVVTPASAQPPIPVATAATSIAVSGFTANWDASAGASGYFLDVASDPGFTIFVPGFQNLAVAGTSQSVTGLTAGTVYYYQVRATDGSLASASSTPITTVTLPVAPTPTAATSITATSFQANWGAVTGATGYQLDVANDVAFSSFVTGFNNLAVAGTSQSVAAGLTSGNTYYYRVRAVDASGAGASSTTITVATIPPAPAPGAETLVTSTGFTVNWSAANGATAYLLDVSLNVGFSSFVTGYNGLNVGNVTSFAVTTLSANTNYFYRLRATNTGGTSVNSGISSQLTAPLPPTATSATLVTSTSLTANWSASAGATGYFLDVATDISFTSFVSGFNNLSVGLAMSTSVPGLTPNTTYYYRVRAQNSGGTSASSSTITQLTAPASPTATAAGSIASTSFSANWTASAGATAYRLDVATDTLFTSILPSYNNLSTPGDERLAHR